MASHSRKRASNTDDLSDNNGHAHTKKHRTRASPLSGAINSGDLHGTTTKRQDLNGDSYWEISKMRRITISSFRGKTMVNIREYYEKDGEELPGKKGISLPTDQFATLLTLLPEIEAALREKGVSVPRPNYADVGTDSNGDDGRHSSPDEQFGIGVRSSRKNIEATSDEDESEE